MERFEGLILFWVPDFFLPLSSLPVTILVAARTGWGAETLIFLADLDDAELPSVPSYFQILSICMSVINSSFGIHEHAMASDGTIMWD